MAYGECNGIIGRWFNDNLGNYFVILLENFHVIKKMFSLNIVNGIDKIES